MGRDVLLKGGRRCGGLLYGESLGNQFIFARLQDVYKTGIEDQQVLPRIGMVRKRRNQTAALIVRLIDILEGR